eukprot:m.14745 g.14745  ORF g.14745 m.14745 type:complete len:66 (+) comp8114_c0_seq1:282-479(+)
MRERRYTEEEQDSDCLFSGLSKKDETQQQSNRDNGSRRKEAQHQQTSDNFQKNEKERCEEGDSGN